MPSSLECVKHRRSHLSCSPIDASIVCSYDVSQSYINDEDENVTDGQLTTKTSKITTSLKVCIIMHTVYVTGFDKSRLSCTLQHVRDTFHHNTIPVHINQLFREVPVQKVTHCCGLFLRLIRCPRVLRWSINGTIFPGQANS